MNDLKDLNLISFLSIQGKDSFHLNRHFYSITVPVRLRLSIKNSGFYLVLRMEGTPISVELELKAYRNSTEEIATLLDTSAQLDSMDVIMQSELWRFFCDF